jgi:hypothetical protein
MHSHSYTLSMQSSEIVNVTCLTPFSVNARHSSFDNPK